MRQIRKVQSSQVSALVESRNLRLKWLGYPEQILFPHMKKFGVYCGRNHALEDCQSLRWKPFKERIHLLFSNKLCFSCLCNEHVSRFCPRKKKKLRNVKKTSYNSIQRSPRERPGIDVGVGTEDDLGTQARSSMVNMGTNTNSGTLN